MARLLNQPKKKKKILNPKDQMIDVKVDFHKNLPGNLHISLKENHIWSQRAQLWGCHSSSLSGKGLPHPAF